MELGNSLQQALIACFPQKESEINQIFTEKGVSLGSQNEGQQVLYSKSPLDGQGESAGYIFPHFGQLATRIKDLLGVADFRTFVDYYVNKLPQNNQIIKEELQRLEKESLSLETLEQEKFIKLSLPPPSFETRDGPPLFCHSTTSVNIDDEFKDAKWVVLTSPIVQIKTNKSLLRENSMNPLSSSLGGNFTIQLTNIGQNSSTRQQSGQGSTNQASSSAAAQAKAQNQAPQKRYGHTACLVRNKMYVFGGLASQQKGGNLQTFYECQLKFATQSEDFLQNPNSPNLLFSWDKIKAEAPRARDSHTTIHVGDSLIMFGGSGGTNSYNDLYKFDLRQQKWHKLEPYGELPAPREGHVAKLIGKDKMLVHGGLDQNETSFNDTYILEGISQFIDNAQISSIYTAYIPNYDMNQNFQTPVSSVYPGAQSSDGIFSAQDQQQLQSMYNSNSETINTIASTSFIQQQTAIQKPSSTISIVNQAQGAKTPQKLRWYKCLERGPVPQGRDSHSSALINNKVYIFGGQGDGDIIFNDLYSCQILEEFDPKTGERLYVAQWELIEPQTPKTAPRPLDKPRARTSHSCTVYKNRYMIIVGGEGELDDNEIRALSLTTGKSTSKGGNKKNRKQSNGDNDINNESGSDTFDAEGNRKASNKNKEESGEEDKVDDFKRPLNDVWVYDTLMQKWHEIHAPFRIQGSQVGKKIKKEFEPRMAHSAVQLNQFLVLFGGLSTDYQLVSNDLYVLSLDGNLGGIGLAFEPEKPAPEPISGPISIQIPQQLQRSALMAANSYQPEAVQIPMIDSNSGVGLQRQSSVLIPNNKNSKASKSLKITNPDDRKIMTGQILNQIINYNSGLTHQYFITGAMPQAQQPNSMTLPPNQLVEANSNYQQQPLRQMTRLDCEIQTLDNDLQSNLQLQAQDNRKQALIIMQRQNDYRLQAQQRTRFSFIKSLVEQIGWPLLCFGSLVDNSIESFENGRLRFEQMKLSASQQHMQIQLQQNQRYINQDLDIEINAKGFSEQEEGTTKYNNNAYLEVKDNGTGIHPKQLMEALTSFGQSNGKPSKSDFSFSEHGIGLKLACLRLGLTSLIISKTRPVTEFGITSYFLSIGLLSSEFMRKADSLNGFLTAPIISYEVKNKKINKSLTPEPEHFLQMISQFTKARFTSGEQILQYALNCLGDLGATHIFMFNLGKQRVEKNGPELPELLPSQGDIQLNSMVYGSQSQSLESSLAAYLNLMYIEYPSWAKITVNGVPLALKNPYSTLKSLHASIFTGEKSEKFAVQRLDLPSLETLIASLSAEDSQSIFLNDMLSRLQGVLIYRGNRLIRRQESVIGEDEDQLLQLSLRKQPSSHSLQFKENAIVSVFKSRSQTTIDKKDFTEKTIVRRVKEWFRQKEGRGSTEHHM